MIKFFKTLTLFLIVSNTVVLAQEQLTTPKSSGEILEEIQTLFADDNFEKALELSQTIHNGDSNYVMHREKYVEHCYSWNAYGARNYGNHAKYGMHQNLLICMRKLWGSPHEHE